MIAGLSAGCDNSPRYIPPQYIEGVVLDEEWIQNNHETPAYPYGFSLKTADGKILSFDVMRDDAASVAAKIHPGDSIRINRGGVSGETIMSTGYIDVFYREGVINK